MFSDMEKKTVGELLKLATENQVVGRHKMKKGELISAILNKQTTGVSVVQPLTVVFNGKKTRQDYMNEIKPGSIVAFNVVFNGLREKTLSGKVAEDCPDFFLIETKIGIVYKVNKADVIWHKTRHSWPNNIYSMLKGVQNANT